MIEHLIFVVMGGIGIATIMVEKYEDYPVNSLSRRIKAILSLLFGERFASVAHCTVCYAFWSTLFCELVAYFLYTNQFTWPISGFISSAIVFYIIDVLNTIERSRE